MSASHNLTPALTAFVGREADLARLAERLGAGARAVTLTGGAGFGKSRLGRELGLRQAGDEGWSGGVWFVSLARQQAGPELCGAVAAALRSTGAGEAERESAAMGERLRTLGRTLLIVDELEPVLPAARQAFAQWLARAPELVVVALSREALSLEGEARHVLGPLPTAASGRDGEGEAERLFVLRAEAVDPGFAERVGASAAVTELVRRLDGNPLAIELAAARMAVLSPEALLARLDDRFRWLRAGASGRGLRESLDESWEALAPGEQRALMQLSLFRGSASLDALEHVLAPAPATELVDALLRKSLLTPTPQPGADGGRRFALYESVRAYARERLADDPALEQATRRQLAAWCEAFAARQAAALETDASARARLLLRDELGNLSEAIDALMSAPPTAAAAESVATLLLALEPVFRREGAAARGLEALTRLGPLMSLLPSARRAALLVARGGLLAARNDEDAATKAFEAALQVAREATDRRLEGFVLMRTSALLHFGGFDRLEGSLREAVAALTEAGDERELAEARAALAVLRVEQGDQAEAQRLFADAIPWMRKRRLVHLLGPALNNLAMSYGLEGRWAEAAGTFREALTAAREDGYRRLECVVLRNLGECALREEDPRGARAFFEAARAVARDVGDVRIQGVSTAFLAAIELLEGAADRAWALGVEARDRLAQAWSDPVAEGLLHAVLALAEAHRGDPTAEASLARARLLLAPSGDPMLRHTHALYAVHLSLLRGATTAAEARARADAISAAAAEPPAGPGPSRRHQVQFARTLLDATLSRGSRTDVDTSQPGLTISADGRHFVTAEGEHVSLARKASARRVLARLAAERLSGAGRALDVEALFEAGWPGDQTGEPHRSNRVYVLVTKLRAAGLRDALAHDGDGYLLDPNVPVTIA